MKKTILVLAAICGSLEAQNIAFQQAGAMAVGGPVTASFGPVMVPPAVTGSPYLATETRHSLQVLGDGTRIEHTDTTQVARDSVGRTRTENENIISINDPVAGYSYVLDKNRKTANKMPGPSLRAKATEINQLQQTVGVIVSNAGPVPPPPGGAVVTMTAPGGPVGVQAFFTSAGAVSSRSSKSVDEDLGSQVINGVAVKGNRTTITIAAGEIGNDRAIQVVNERWYSDVLQTVVKTSNSDPRFGTTDYELTNISQGAPDPSLFELPAGYTIIDHQR